MPVFDRDARATALARLAREQFDVLVVGGGITGAGVAREAALQGFSVALVEARDFASGTSSRSSKLIHGGLRYLQQGEVGLVREAATERRTLRRIAPHLTVTAPMLVPVYGRTSAGVYKLRVGLGLFDKLAGVPSEERHRILGRDEALAVEPHLARTRLQGAGVYPEYHTDDARLVLATVKAAAAIGAVLANRVSTTALHDDGGMRVVELRDEETGATLATRARVVVNAAGPWVDAVRNFERTSEGPALHLTKGVHLTFRRDDLPSRHCVVMRAPDGRPVFTVPRAHDVYVGTTDTSYEGPLDEPAVTPDDAAYLFAAIAATFDGLALAPRHVIGTWAGLRPLVYEAGKKPSEISRKDEVVVSAAGMITIAGGKLTTFRRMAERVLEAVVQALGTTPRPSRSAEEPLAGGDLDGAPDLEGWAASFAVRPRLAALDPALRARLVATYGTEALDLAAAPADELVPLAEGAALTAAEVRFAVRAEMARTLADVLERRSRIALFDTDAAAALAPAAAAIVAAELGWDATRRDAEVAAFLRQCDARLAWRDGAPSGDAIASAVRA
jgi:glycerol-3-phosphate dehydrogenase